MEQPEKSQLRSVRTSGDGKVFMKVNFMKSMAIFHR